MKRMGLAALLLTTSMAAGVLVGCGSSNSSADSTLQQAASADTKSDGATEGEGEKVKESSEDAPYIVFLEGTDANSWRTQCENAMQKQADKYIASGEISKYKLFVANNDATTQIQQMEQAIQDGAGAIIINPVSTTGLTATIDKATKAGIKVFSIDQHITHPDVISITNDQYTWAKIQAEWFVKQIDGKGNIYVMNAIQGAPASDIREQAFNDVLSKYPDIKVIASDYGMWDEGKGKEIMTQWLATNKDYDAVLCQDGVAVGILEAIEAAGANYPKAITSDEYIQYLKKWKEINDANPDEPLNAIIVENPPSIGVMGMKIAVRLLKGDQLKDDALQSDPADPDNKNAIFYNPTTVITLDNMEEYYEKYKDADDSSYIDTDMTDELIATYFK